MSVIGGSGDDDEEEGDDVMRVAERSGSRCGKRAVLLWLGGSAGG